ncbi:hypothetical protein GCM10022221_19140 [Actinocorallia aurea]
MAADLLYRAWRPLPAAMYTLIVSPGILRAPADIHPAATTLPPQCENAELRGDTGLGINR